MAEPQDNSHDPAPLPDVAAKAVPRKREVPPPADMTVNEMREWLRNWISNDTGQSPDAINDSVPMV